MWHVICPCRDLCGKHKFQAGRWRETRPWLSLDLHLGKTMIEFLLGPRPQIFGKRGFYYRMSVWDCMTFAKSKWSIGSWLRYWFSQSVLSSLIELSISHRPLWLRKSVQHSAICWAIELIFHEGTTDTCAATITVPRCSTCSYGLSGTYRG